MTATVPMARLLTPADVGERLKVSAKMARRLRDFPWRDIGTGRRPVLRCSEQDYEQWLEEQRPHGV